MTSVRNFYFLLTVLIGYCLTHLTFQNVTEAVFRKPFLTHKRVPIAQSHPHFSISLVYTPFFDAAATLPCLSPVTGHHLAQTLGHQLHISESVGTNTLVKCVFCDLHCAWQQLVMAQDKSLNSVFLPRRFVLSKTIALVTVVHQQYIKSFTLL